ncbi:MAG: hypothetical protein M0005_09220, partial [Actinomycetota bacterium]|nr:hypothetical protein [Actinomycetota bacterium]
MALARWGTPLIADAAPDDAIRAHWVPFSASVFLRGRDPGGIPVTVQLHTPLGSSVIEITTDGVTSRAGAADEPDITLEGELAMLDALRGDKPDVGLAEAADRVWHWLSDPAHRDLLKLWME